MSLIMLTYALISEVLHRVLGRLFDADVEAALRVLA